MKRLLNILIMAIIMVTFTGCSSNNNSTKNNDEPKEVVTAANSDKTEIKLNEPFEVSTESGDYSFTITGVTKTDWWNRNYKNNDKQIILLNYECNNISFKNSNHDGLLLDETAFSAIDDKNYLLDAPSFGYEASRPKLVPIGLKAKFNIPFIAENDTKNITIKFRRGGEIILPIE